MDILRNIAILVFLGFLIYYGIFLSMKTIDVKTAALRFPWGIIYLSAPASAVFMVIHTIELILYDIQMLFSEKK
jgi:TRAP-type C4-dicarboxylate transport system permease small subunit